jgi:dUTP pyrophosphatase
MQIKIKYFNDKLLPLEKITKGNWIDLRASRSIVLRKGESLNIPLGIAMELPQGYEAHIVPRGSTFKNFKIVQTNHMGVVDTTYCGDTDEWSMPVLAVENTVILMNERICQFRIMESMCEFEFITVKTLGNVDRSGFGSTGIK